MIFILFCIGTCNSIGYNSKNGVICFVFLHRFRDFISLFGVFSALLIFRLVLVSVVHRVGGMVAQSPVVALFTSISALLRVELKSDDSLCCV